MELWIIHALMSSTCYLFACTFNVRLFSALRKRNGCTRVVGKIKKERQKKQKQNWKMEKISCTTVKVPSMHWKQKKKNVFFLYFENKSHCWCKSTNAKIKELDTTTILLLQRQYWYDVTASLSIFHFCYIPFCEGCKKVQNK